MNPGTVPDRYPALARAAAGQPRAGHALTAALDDGASHAYLFEGPSGSAKTAIARAFAAELLAAGSSDPAETRRRALLDPSPHPDLVWLRPRGMSHAVEEVRSRVIRKVLLNPFEGSRRVFVIEAAGMLNEESQNAMLKTLEEPPAHAHLLLLSTAAEGVLPTITSRCQRIATVGPSPELIRERLAGWEGAAGLAEENLEAVARLARGDLGRARELARESGRALRQATEDLLAAALDDRLADSPWRAVLELAEAAGEEAAAVAEAELDAEREEGVKRTARERDEACRRARRRRRTEVLDLGLSLAAAWARDWVCLLSGAAALAFNSDRLERLGEQAERIEPAAARRAVGIVAATGRRFRLNVSEELALEAMSFRLEETLRS